MPKKRTLSPTGAETFRRCPRLYQLRKEYEFEPKGYAPALEIGKAMHEAGAAYRERKDRRVVMDTAAHHILSAAADASEVGGEYRDQAMADSMKVATMLQGYLHSLQVDPPEVPLFTADNEMELHAPLVNPETGRASRTFELHGFIDGLIAHTPLVDFGEQPRREYYLYEMKTTSGTVNDLVKTVRAGVQLPVYQEMLRLGRGVEVVGTVLDIIKKPVLRPRRSKKNGVESPQEYNARCLEAYQDDPARFFRRVVIDYDEVRVREAREALWAVARQIRECFRWGFPALCGAGCNGQFGWCQFRELCWYQTVENYTYSPRSKRK